MRIPESFIRLPKIAIIVPAFEYMPKMKVNKDAFSRAVAAYLPSVPTTKRELAACMLLKYRNCTIFRDKAHLHVLLQLSLNMRRNT